MALEWYATDAAGNILGQVAVQRASLTIRRNGAGGGSVVFAPTKVDIMTVKGIALRRNGAPLGWFSIESLDAAERDNVEAGEYTAECRDRTAAIGDRAAYPDPITGDFSTAAYDTFTGPASSAIFYYLKRNMGSDALPERQASWLTLGTDPAIGKDVSVQARLDGLLDLIARIAALGEVEFGFDPDTGAFEVWEAVERNRVVSVNTVADLHWRVAAPKATVAIVGGAGEGTARAFATAVNAAAVAEYGRREAFLDRRQSPTNMLYREGASWLLTEAAGGFAADAVLLPRGGIGEYWTDWRLGDIFTVRTSVGEYQAVAVSMRIEYGEKETVTLSLSSGPLTPQQRPFAFLNAVSLTERRVKLLETV